jgi:predicted tellurium resistance membrane protein TerC
MPLVIFGLLVSIPIIVGGSQLVIKLMDRFPLVITLGGMLLGWIAGSMAVTDPALLHLLPTQPASHAGATVEVIPRALRRRGHRRLLVLLIGRAVVTLKARGQ